ncbi:hypothetical protein TSA1_15910 [Bradyrhizobium nitroreducens]|uniref:Uncharacterized protein n=1 Tax=Bradyrhizobium nitroreducens TaxID=709803 RepID=A0A2M6UBY4_9BRAD|nr:hypothetical protein TSA1_15910 [Bradyrhizobium nitroreducens]TQF37841.1 hypothetical protein UNPF46_17885 [Bradyrhizobium sp. UNPF46]
MSNLSSIWRRLMGRIGKQILSNFARPQPRQSIFDTMGDRIVGDLYSSAFEDHTSTKARSEIVWIEERDTRRIVQINEPDQCGHGFRQQGGLRFETVQLVEVSCVLFI